MHYKERHIKQGRSAYRLRAAVLSLLLCLLLVSCEKENYEPETDPLRTVLFYMGGDNNLSGEVNAKIEQLKTVPVPASCRLIIYKDARNSTPQLLEVISGNGGNTLKVIRDYEESNSADAAVFASVLREITELYPAPSYGMVLFSHASGWMPEGTYDNPSSRSVVIDGKSEMEIPALAAAMPDGMFDFVIFEACFMAGIEVAYELKDKTDYIVASSAEIVSPGFAPVYTKALPLLFKPQADLTGFVKAIEADYRTREGDYGSLTLSLIKTQNLEALVAAVMGGHIGEYAISSGNAPQSFSRRGDDLFFDFGDCFKQGLAADRAEALQAAISDCVVYKTATAAFMPTYSGFDIVSHSGLTTYMPQERYPKLNEAYKSTKWYKAIYDQ